MQHRTRCKTWWPLDSPNCSLSSAFPQPASGRCKPFDAFSLFKPGRKAFQTHARQRWSGLYPKTYRCLYRIEQLIESTDQMEGISGFAQQPCRRLVDFGGMSVARTSVITPPPKASRATIADPLLPPPSRAFGELLASHFCGWDARRCVKLQKKTCRRECI